MFYFKDRVEDKKREVYRGYLNLLIAGNVIYFLFILSFPDVTRLSLAYLYYEIFLIGLMISSIHRLQFKVLAFSLLLVFGGFRLYSFMAPYLDYYLPFKTFLN